MNYTNCKLHNDYPIAPERLAIAYDILKSCRQIWNKS